MPAVRQSEEHISNEGASISMNQFADCRMSSYYHCLILLNENVAATKHAMLS